MAHVGDYCPNADCQDYGKLQNAGQQNIIKFGKTQKGRQRYRCKTCKQTFTETKGTWLYGKRTAAAEILEVLALLAEGSRISSLSRVKKHKEDTIIQWLAEAAVHVEEVEAALLAKYQITRGQLDGLWVYVGNQGEKKGIPRPRKVDSSGAPRCSIWTRAYG